MPSAGADSLAGDMLGVFNLSIKVSCRQIAKLVSNTTFLVMQKFPTLARAQHMNMSLRAVLPICTVSIPTAQLLKNLSKELSLC